ncbi:hypothetical protein H4217_008652, partial [Coemansia sp. RSA 1939]
MDVRVDEQPFVQEGVHWSVANRWIIGTSSQISIITPHCTMRDEAMSKSSTSARVATSQEDIEGVCLLDSLPNSFSSEYAVVLLVSDSNIRIFAPKGLPHITDWSEVGHGAFETNASHVCAIVSAQILDSNGDAFPMVCCASISGETTVLGLAGAQDGRIEAKRVLRFRSGHETISHMEWVVDGAADSVVCKPLLAVCAVDGLVNLWDISRDLADATMVCTLGDKDWRPITSSDSRMGLLVLAKLGTVIVVDTNARGTAKASLQAGGFGIEYIDIGISQSIISCVIDDQRERIYVGAMDFAIFVLKRTDKGRWERAGKKEESTLREGLRKTVVRSFTTKFNMSRLLLRSMHISPNRRFLAFVADDQVNWGLVKDGLGVTRIHFHQFGDWSMEMARLALDRIVGGNYHGDLPYNVWDIFQDNTADEFKSLIEYLNQMQLPEGSEMFRQRLFILNILGHTLKCLLGRIKESVGGKDAVLS